MPKEVLDGKETGEQIVIIGGGSVGCETAEYLAEKGKKVTVIEMLDTMAEKMVNVARTILMGHLKDWESRCSLPQVSGDYRFSVACQDKEGTVHTIPADTVVAAVGRQGWQCSVQSAGRKGSGTL